jgi:hypothetical protein
VKFIPRPVVIGFTNGIALLIASTQIKDFLGLRLEEVPPEFLPRGEAIGRARSATSRRARPRSAWARSLAIVAVERLGARVPGTSWRCSAARRRRPPGLPSRRSARASEASRRACRSSTCRSSGRT